MKIGFMNKTIEGVLSKNNFLMISNLALAFAVAYLVVDKVNDHERVTLTPPYIDKPMSISWRSANAEYLKSIGLYMATLTANVTPKNVTFVADQLESMVSSRIYPDVRKKLLVLANDPLFAATGESGRFQPNRVIFEAETSKVFVTGEMTSRNAAGKAESVVQTIEMVILIESGRPILDGFDHYEGSEARTLAWKDSHRNQVSEAEKQKEKSL